MKKFAAYLLWFLLIAVLPLMACSNDGMTEAVAGSFDVQFECPSLIEVAKGGEYTFQVTGSNKPAESDVIILESTGGISYTCVLVSVSENSFTIKLADGCESGTYRVFVKRGDRKKQIGTTYINIVEGIDFTPDAGTTVYGVVSTADGPVQGVVVSDGVEVSVTDERGIYQLQSEKKWGYVFISVPSGYEVPAEGVLPRFYQMMKGDAATTERVDFSLTEVEGQDSYKVFMLGDMHLANRTGDLGQFMDFTEDLNSYRALHQHEKMYAITLGDMTWDLYWYSNSYALPEYLNTINNQVKGLQIFHTIGNHDYDYKAMSDEEAGSRFMDYIAPTYYSFNIGKVHYVVLDDIDCSNYDGTTSRDYEKRVSAEQLSWLSKDLAYVDKSTPLVVVMHAQLFYPSQTEGFKIDHDVLNTTQLLDVLDGYKVHFVTGHTHLSFNVTPEDEVTGGREVYEHNARCDMRFVVVVGLPYSGCAHQSRRNTGRILGMGCERNGHRMDIQGYGMDGGLPVPQLRPEQCAFLDGGCAADAGQCTGFGQGEIPALCGCLSGEQGQRGADKHLELESALDADGDRREGQQAYS